MNSVIRLTLLTLATLNISFALAEPALIGDRRELLVDHALIESLKDCSLQMHSPRPSGVAIQLDKPWEGQFSAYFTVLRDNTKYRLYYRGLPVLADASDVECTCYAESPDGINWTKPDLGIYEIRGTKKNNVVLFGHAPASHNFTPFIDDRPGVVAEERYKALGGERNGLWAFVSQDGIHWKKLQEKPVLTGSMFDSQNVAFWSASEGKYLSYFRHWIKVGGTEVRGIARSTSQDFRNWTAPEPMNFGDAPIEELYTNQTTPYFRAPHIYVALPMRYFGNRMVLDDEAFAGLDLDPKYRGYVRRESSDGVLMTSRGGSRYDRTFMEAFMRPGLDRRNWVSRTMMSALGVVQTGPDEMSIYYRQHDGQPTSHLIRCTLRLDGFSSAHTSYAGGELITKPIIFNGDELEINFSTGAGGSVRVEIQDEIGTPIPGFLLSQSMDLVGDSVAQIVAWQSGSDVEELAGQSIRLRFAMKDADLYSYRFRTSDNPKRNKK